MPIFNAKNDSLKFVLFIVLVIGGICCSVVFNVSWTYHLLVDIINAFRSTNPVATEDIAWLIIKLCMRGIIFIVSTFICLIPAGLFAVLKK